MSLFRVDVDFNADADRRSFIRVDVAAVCAEVDAVDIAADADADVECAAADTVFAGADTELLRLLLFFALG